MENTTHTLGFSSAFLKLQEEPFESVESSLLRRTGTHDELNSDVVWGPCCGEHPQCLGASDNGSRTFRGHLCEFVGASAFLSLQLIGGFSFSSHGLRWGDSCWAISMGRVLPLARHSRHLSSCFTIIYLAKPIRFYLQDDYITQQKQKQSRALGVENFPQKDSHSAGKVPSPRHISLL